MRPLAMVMTLLLGSMRAWASDGKPLNSGEALLLAPPAPALPRGLTLTKRLNGGVWLPPDTAHALHVYLIEWERYPEQAQAAMDALADVIHTNCEEGRHVQAAQDAMLSDKRSASAEAHRLTLGRVLGIGAVSAALGLIAGIVLAQHH